MNARTVEYFAKVPHDLLLASMPDKLKLLLCYGIMNAPTYRHNIPDARDFLKCDKRTAQRHFKTLIDNRIFTATTPQSVKHGKIPNYHFKREAVPAYLKRLPHHDLTGVESLPQPMTQPATRPATEPATPDHANKNNKQEEEVRRKKPEERNRDFGISHRPLSSQPPTADSHGTDWEKELEDFFSDSTPTPSRMPLRPSSSQPPTADSHGRDWNKEFEEFLNSDDTHQASPAPLTLPPTENQTAGEKNNTTGWSGLSSPSPSTSQPGVSEGRGDGNDAPTPPEPVTHSATACVGIDAYVPFSVSRVDWSAEGIERFFKS